MLKYQFFFIYLTQHTGLYPLVAKGMRLAAQGKDPLEGQKHMCGMGNVYTYHSTGFPELDDLMREPQPLMFIMELISVRFQTNMHTCTHTLKLQPRGASCSFTHNRFLSDAQTIQGQAQQNIRQSCKKHWREKLFPIFN